MKEYVEIICLQCNSKHIVHKSRVDQWDTRCPCGYWFNYKKMIKHYNIQEVRK